MSTRPNVLFLMSDEHRWNVSGFAGDGIVRTPTLDWLARDGVVFENAYTPSPICVPARQAMAVGLYPSSCGVRRYGEDLPSGSMTFARRFAEYAYYAVACGKLHHAGEDQMQGWIRRITMEDQIAAPRYVAGAVDSEFDRYRGKTEDVRGNLSGKKWTMQKEIKRAGAGISPYTNWDELATRGMEYLIDEQIVSAYYDKPHSAPLLLYLGLANPHYPMIAPPDLFAHYLNRVSPTANRRLPSNPWHTRADNYWRGPYSVGSDGDITEREERRALAGYYANVEAMDSRYGRVLGALREAGEDLDDWIIVYTSDHGDMLGEHGFWEKHSFFEGSAKVPLVIRWPRRFDGGRRVRENVNLCDLFATLCELADLPTPGNLDSRSLVPLLEGGDSGWRDITFSEIDGTAIMVKSKDLKYTWYGPDYPEELFDLAADPTESQDLRHDSSRTNDLNHLRGLGDEFRNRCERRLGEFEGGLP